MFKFNKRLVLIIFFIVGILLLITIGVIVFNKYNYAEYIKNVGKVEELYSTYVSENFSKGIKGADVYPLIIENNIPVRAEFNLNTDKRIITEINNRYPGIKSNTIQYTIYIL